MSIKMVGVEGLEPSKLGVLSAVGVPFPIMPHAHKLARGLRYDP